MKLYPNPPYRYAETAHGLVFTAGACPLDAEGRVVAPGDLGAQALQTVENLTAALAAAGAGTEDIIKTTIYVATQDRSDLVRAWDVVSARLGSAPSTLLGVSILGYPDQLIEVEAVAAVD
jgi:enamine deaminase RidA (YjgF/YER057c/UK114 family)